MSTPESPEPPYPHLDTDFEAARSRLSTPAVILLVLAVLGVLTSCGNLAMTALTGARQNEQLLRAIVGDEAIVDQALAASGGALAMAIQVASLIASIVVGVGAWKMYRVESYPLAVAAAILSVVPLCSPCCCCFGIPVGIWALVILVDPKVQAQFR